MSDEFVGRGKKKNREKKNREKERRPEKGN